MAHSPAETLHWSDSRVEVHKVVVGPDGQQRLRHPVPRDRRRRAARRRQRTRPAPRAVPTALGVRTVLETHGHWDHIQAIPAIRDAGYEVGVTAEGRGDAARATTTCSRTSRSSRSAGSASTPTTRPGTHPGSMSFSVEGTPLLFTGDTLFPGGPGNTSFEGGDFPTILRSIEDRMFSKFDGRHPRVLPGHGDDTTIGDRGTRTSTNGRPAAGDLTRSRHSRRVRRGGTSDARHGDQRGRRRRRHRAVRAGAPTSVSAAVVSSRSARLDEGVEAADDDRRHRSSVVCPGFVDVHTHYDAQGFWDPNAQPVAPPRGHLRDRRATADSASRPLGGDPSNGDYLMRMLARVEGMPLEALQEAVPVGLVDLGSDYLEKPRRQPRDQRRASRSATPRSVAW